MARFCIGCGRAAADGLRFCTGCGRALAGGAARAAALCSACGTALGMGLSFCTRCGAAVRGGAGAGAAARARSRGVPRVVFGIAALLAVAVGAWALLWSGGGSGRGGGTASGPIRLEMPEGSPAATVTPVGNLERLRAMPGGGRILAAGRFEPDGLSIPWGARVTYTLPAPKAPGTVLPMLVLDEERGVWSPTGVEARVAQDGRSAVGRMFHFTHGAVAEDEEHSLVVRPAQSKGVHTIDPAKLKAALEIYQNHSGGLTPEVMKSIYREAGFHGVKTLIEDGKVSQQHSMDMADLRILMILQTLERMAGQKYRIWRSDSGNQSSGMSSDVDQTLFVEEWQDGRWVRSEDADAKFAQDFASQFLDMHQVPVELFDIATIAGRDKFPDHRVTRSKLGEEGRRSFAQHARETMFTLRRTPGAYTFCGAVVQQMQLRVMEKVGEQLRAGQEAARPPEPRGMHELLKRHSPDLQLNQLLLLQIGRGDGDDTTVRAREAFQEDATRVMFDSLPPKLVRGHVYDAAVANYFEFMHHLEDKYPAVKYHLRSLDDGLSRLHSLDTGTKRIEYEKVPENRRRHMLSKVLGADLGRPGIDGKSFLDRWKTAFDISAELRRLHGAKALTPDAADNAFKGLAMEIAIQVEISALHGTGALDTKGGPEASRRQMEEAAERVRRDPEAWKPHLEAARASYDRRCQEFMLHGMVATAQQRVAEFVSPDADTLERQGVLERIVDEGPLRKQLQLEGPQNEALWRLHREEFVRNHAFQAEMQLLYSFREIGAERPDLVEMILKDAEGKLSADDAHRLRLIAKRARSWFFGVTEYRAFPKSVRRFAYLAGKQLGAHLCAKASSWALSEVGWTDDGESRRPSDLLRALGFRGAHERARAALAKHRTAGIVDRFVGKAVLHPGSLIGALAVMRAYSESGGDPEVLQASLTTEAINLLPIVGLVYGSYMAGTDLVAQGMIWLPLVSPTFGVCVLCYAAGEHAIVIYQHEISAPLKNTMADAIYRGYVGPSMTRFADTPPEFTESEGTHLKTLDGMVEELKARVAADEGDLGSAYALSKTVAEQEALQAKRAAWQVHARDERLRKEGGALFNLGGFESQRPVYLPKPSEGDQPYVHEGALLDRIRPIIHFPADVERGPVDFRIAALTPAQEHRLGELEKTLREPHHPAEWVVLRAEYEALGEQKVERARADEYRAKALLDRELMHQIRRDSLYPQLIEWDAQRPRMDDPEYLQFWVAVRSESLKKTLEELGVGDPRPHGADIRKALLDRLLADLRRSAELWQGHELLQTARAEALKKQTERGASALEAERLMIAAIQRPVTLGEEAQAALKGVGADVREVVSPAALGRALLERHVPESAPRLVLGLRRIPETDDQGKRVGWEYRPDTTVEANPDVFVPPYVAVTHALDPIQAREALGAGAWKGMPLDQETRGNLERHLAALGPLPADFDPAKGEYTPVFLTFAFCHDVRLEQRVVPETVAHLPRYPRMEIPPAEGMPPLPAEVRTGYLLGGGALVPKGLAGGKVKIRMVDTPSRAVDVIDVTSEALERLEPGEGGLLFELYRASTEAGLATSKPLVTEFVSAATPIEADRDAKWGRMAKDRFRLSGSRPGADEVAFFYRVIQIPATGSNARDAEAGGTPEKSNILGPAPEIRINIDTVPGRPDTYQIDYHPLPVGLGFAAQAGLVPGAHIRAATRGGTWHYWTARDGTRDWVDVWVGEGPEDAEATLEADGGGMKATRKIRLLASPAMKHRVEEQVARRVADMEVARRNGLKELAGRKAAVEGARTGLADFQRRFAGQGWYGVQSIANAEMGLREAEARLALFEQVELPDREASGDASLAFDRGDFGAQILVLRRRIALARERGEGTKRIYEANAAQLATLAGSAPNDASRQPHEKSAARQRELAESAEDRLQDDVGDLGSELANAGKRAGDGEAVREGMALRVKALEHAKARGTLKEAAYARARGEAFLRLADDMALLTGRRDQSKALFEEGRTWLLKGTPPEQRAALEESWKRARLPDWWPE